MHALQKFEFLEIKWTTMGLPRKLEANKLMKGLWLSKILREKRCSFWANYQQIFLESVAAQRKEDPKN